MSFRNLKWYSINSLQTHDMMEMGRHSVYHKADDTRPKLCPNLLFIRSSEVIQRFGQNSGCVKSYGPKGKMVTVIWGMGRTAKKYVIRPFAPKKPRLDGNSSCPSISAKLFPVNFIGID